MWGPKSVCCRQAVRDEHTQERELFCANPVCLPCLNLLSKLLPAPLKAPPDVVLGDGHGMTVPPLTQPSFKLHQFWCSKGYGYNLKKIFFVAFGA